MNRTFDTPPSAPCTSAIVIGASMAGLLAARVLADHYDRVTLIERDAFTDGPEVRKGVPQGAHVHGIWPRGLDYVERQLPGLKQALVAAGASVGDVARDMNWHQFGGLKMREPVGIQVTLASRPLLEQQVRRRVLERAHVTALQDVSVSGLAVDLDGRRVTGVRLRRPRGHEELLRADLVVDATGRSGQATRWLSEHGHDRPVESKVRIDLTYATRVYERRSCSGAIGHIVFPTPPVGKRGAAAFAIEGNRWLVTLIGFMGEAPPIDDAGYIEYARSLPMAAVHDIVRNERPDVARAVHRFPSNLRRHYEKLRRFPQGFVVIGDALASFNPAYGQGMTVAALQAEALQVCLQGAPVDGGFAQRYFKKVARVIDVPWMIATGEDLRYPEAEGRRPLLLDPLNAYFTRMHQAATVDSTVCRAFFGVAGLQSSPATAFAPATVWRILRGARRFGARAAVNDRDHQTPRS